MSKSESAKIEQRAFGSVIKKKNNRTLDRFTSHDASIKEKKSGQKSAQRKSLVPVLLEKSKS